MTSVRDIYKCQVCDNIVEVVHAGVGVLVCCNQPMELMPANTVDASKEKHVPVITPTEDGFLVETGSTPHPMVKEHYIEWIDLLTSGQVLRQYLKPEDKPRAVFSTSADKVSARAYCNLHGLWRAE